MHWYSQNTVHSSGTQPCSGHVFTPDGNVEVTQGHEDALIQALSQILLF